MFCLNKCAHSTAFIEKLSFFFFFNALRHVCVFVHVNVVPAEAREGVGSGETVVVGGCEPGVGTKSQTRVL